MEADESENALMRYGYSLYYFSTYDPDFKHHLVILRQLFQKVCYDHRNVERAKKNKEVIPLDNVAVVMEYLDESSLCSAASVSKSWRQLSCRDSLWSKLVMHRFGTSPNELNVQHEKRQPLSPFHLFRQLHRQFLCTARAGRTGLIPPNLLRISP